MRALAATALTYVLLFTVAPRAAVLIGAGIEYALDLDVGPIPPGGRP